MRWDSFMGDSMLGDEVIFDITPYSIDLLCPRLIQSPIDLDHFGKLVLAMPHVLVVDLLLLPLRLFETSDKRIGQSIDLV